MAMEQVQIIKDTHNKSITAVGYNPIKHEILAGFEGILANIFLSLLISPRYILIITKDFVVRMLYYIRSDCSSLRYGLSFDKVI
jgi:hypothetical protein